MTATGRIPTKKKGEPMIGTMLIVTLAATGQPTSAPRPHPGGLTSIGGHSMPPPDGVVVLRWPDSRPAAGAVAPPSGPRPAGPPGGPDRPGGDLTTPEMLDFFEEVLRGGARPRPRPDLH